MNTRTKNRLILAVCLIAAALVASFALWRLDDRSASVEVAQAASGAYEGKNIQVSGVVVNDSLQVAEGKAYFTITGEQGQADISTPLAVIYEGPMPATFGNGVVALCTGRMDQQVLNCSQLITKCPSKYESAQGALTVDQLRASSERSADELKVAGTIVPGSLQTTTQGTQTLVRFDIESEGASVTVVYAGEVSKEFADGTAVVIRGVLRDDQTFEARDVAIDADTSKQRAPQAQKPGA